MRRALALAPVLLVGACSLTTDLDGYSGGSRANGTDGGKLEDVATIPVGDGGPSLPPPLGEGGSEAGTPGCRDAPVAVCEEFDADEKKNGWTVMQVNGASLSTVTVPWGEHGLLVTMPAASSGDAPLAYWEKKLDKTVSKLNFDIDLEYDQSPANPGEYHNTFAVRVDHGDTYNVLYLSIGSGATGWAVQDFPVHDGNLDYRVVPLPSNQRLHVHFDIEVGGRSRFAVNGVVQADNPTPAFLLAGQPTLDIGASASGVPSTAMSMGFGHLVFTGE